MCVRVCVCGVSVVNVHYLILGVVLCSHTENASIRSTCGLVSLAGTSPPQAILHMCPTPQPTTDIPRGNAKRDQEEEAATKLQ